MIIKDFKHGVIFSLSQLLAQKLNHAQDILKT